jgi:hypothetical protein
MVFFLFKFSFVVICRLTCLYVGSEEERESAYLLILEWFKNRDVACGSDQNQIQIASKQILVVVVVVLVALSENRGRVTNSGSLTNSVLMYMYLFYLVYSIGYFYLASSVQWE